MRASLARGADAPEKQVIRGKAARSVFAGNPIGRTLGTIAFVMRDIAVELKDIPRLQVSRVPMHGQPHLTLGQDGMHSKRMRVGIQYGMGCPFTLDHLVKACSHGFLPEFIKAR